MHKQGRAIVWMVIALAAASGGYIWWDHSRSDADAGLEEDLSQVEPTTNPLQPTQPQERELRLQLAKGESFPLIKTIDEKIVQKTLAGNVTSRSRTKVQLVLAIRVMDVHSDRTTMRVDYRRVIYEHDIAGEKLHYDSATPPRVVPAEVQAYAGLVNNGFEFDIGPDNRILQLKNFRRFVERCVAHVPREQRNAVMAKFMETSSDEGVANFVDDSIGLLPFHDKTVKVGDTWQRNRTVQRPVPLRLSQKCELKKLNAEHAEVSITGAVSPSATYGPANQPQNGLQVVVRSGRLYGTCRIRSRNGLPEHSEIVRNYDMLVRYPDKRRFAQTKSSRTTIEVYQQQGRPKAIGRVIPNTARRLDRFAAN